MRRGITTEWATCVNKYKNNPNMQVQTRTYACRKVATEQKTELNSVSSSHDQKPIMPIRLTGKRFKVAANIVCVVARN